METLARAVVIEKSRRDQIKGSPDCVSLELHVSGTTMHNTFKLNEWNGEWEDEEEEKWQAR